MNSFQTIDDYPETINAYGADEAARDGALVNLLPACPDVMPLKEIEGLDGYLKNYGTILGKKAVNALAPLHVPFRDPLPDFDVCPSSPAIPGQQHVIAAAVKMLDRVGNGFIVGEMGTGKTLLGMLAAHFHAYAVRKQGGSRRSGTARSSSAPTT